MNFSYEELYFMYGQYDAFVTLHFGWNTQSKQMFEGKTIMGTFLFTNQERMELEALRGTVIPRTEKRMKFVPSELHSFSDEICVYLDRDGLLCSDIFEVDSLMLERRNRYATKGNKEIPGIKINVDTSDFCADKTTLWVLSQRLKRGEPLIDFEMIGYYGLMLFFFPEMIQANEAIYEDFPGRKTHCSIKFRFLKAKFYNSTLTEEEDAEFQNLIGLIGKSRIETLMAEFTKATENLAELKKYETKVRIMYRQLALFDEETLVAGKFPVWWDYERFVHIYMRHVREVQIGSRFEDKTKLNQIESTRILNDVLKESPFKKDLKELLMVGAPEDFTFNAYMSKGFILLNMLGLDKEKNKKTNFISLANDAEHAYYGALCDILVTEDVGLRYKAEVLYEVKGIHTKILSPKEFVDCFSDYKAVARCRSGFATNILEQIKEIEPILTTRSDKYNRITSVYHLKESYFDFFDQIELIEDEASGTWIILTSQRNNLNVSLFFDEISVTLNKMLQAFGQDMDRKGVFNDQDREEMKECGADWTGRLWSLDQTLGLDINEGTNRLSISVFLSPGNSIKSEI
jgi:hypothetical protein